ncbi:MAG: homocysteine methyltransferase [Clostridia bacterium]|nr:homocysteine methyltransferase [Clostridia bacterium]
MELPLPQPLLMDGATGTQLQKRGMPLGVSTERWALENPEILLEIQRSYVEAGAGILLTPTPCANRAALARHGLEHEVEDFNVRLAALTREAAGERALVAGDLGPSGLSIPPYGETPFEAMVDLYAEQAGALIKGGVDLFAAESMLSMAEARAVVLGVRRVSDKPILVTCWCDEEGRTPSDTDLLAIGIVMQGMGAAAFGVNCVEPSVAEEQLKRLAPYLTIPLIAKPSAGLPERVEGKAVYRLSPEELAGRVPAWAACGVRLFGGCCGTGPEHIAALREAVAEVDFAALPRLERDPDVIPCASEKEARFITPDVDVGETIECTPDFVEDILEAEEEHPVGALKIAVLDQDDLDLFAEEQYAIRDALCLWSDVPEFMEGALRAYQGRAFYDGTADLEPEVLERLSKEYGLIVL